MLALLVSVGLACHAPQDPKKAALPIYLNVPPRVAGLWTPTRKPAEKRTIQHIRRIVMRGPSVQDFLDALPLMGTRAASLGPTWAAFHYRYATILLGVNRRTARANEVTLIIYPSGSKSQWE
jgi:hypothetical protein